MGSRKYEAVQPVRQHECGMITLEAACIIPTILFVLVLVLCFFFYGLEIAVAEGTMREEMAKAADSVKTEGDYETGDYQIEKLNERKLLYLLNYGGGKTETKLKNAIEAKLAKRSLFGKDTKVEVAIKSGNVKATVISYVPIPILGSSELVGEQALHIEQSGMARVRIPAEEIRRFDNIE